MYKKEISSVSILVTSPAQVIDNILRFQSKLEDSLELQNRLAYARAWYAQRDKEGRWHFGPSKFCGYQNLTAEEYIERSQELNGRRTEKQLNQWYIEVPENEELYTALANGLADFLAQYDKSPSAKMRINVLTTFYDNELVGPSDSSLVDLLIAVAKRLPSRERAQVRASL